MKLERGEWVADGEVNLCPITLTVDGISRKSVARVSVLEGKITLDMGASKAIAVRRAAKELFMDILYEEQPEFWA